MHELVSGYTGSGKTHYACARADAWPGPVLFWTPQEDPLLHGWVRADRHSQAADLFRNPRARINYVPHYDDRLAVKEAGVIVSHLFNQPGRRPIRPVLLIFDEADLLAPQGSRGTPLHRVAKQGRKEEIWADFVTQFPADIDKSIVRNCLQQIYFGNPYAAEYYHRQRLPGDVIINTLAAAPEHSFMAWGMGRLTGPHRL